LYDPSVPQYEQGEDLSQLGRSRCEVDAVVDHFEGSYDAELQSHDIPQTSAETGLGHAV
jgi:hypothetical protein